MANHYHKNTSGATGEPQAELVLKSIQTFVARCRRPAVLEFGEEPQSLLPGQYALELSGGKLRIEVWSEARSLSRRILGIERQVTGVLDCTIHRFGGKPGRLSFLDMDRPQAAHKKLCGVRENFSEQFRRMLFRQFPGWEIRTLTSSLDLRRSFSAMYPRACLVNGHQQIAALACANVEDEAALLTAALIWHDYLRRQSKEGLTTGLSLFLPDTAGNLTAHRLRWLTGNCLGKSGSTRLFRFNAHGSAGEVDPEDLGNLETRVRTTPANVVPADQNLNVIASERHLEWAVRSQLVTIDPGLAPSPVHAQVLTFAATDRDLIDLLAVSLTGRLAVLELKVSEDLHLPIQALDYWMRIRWHAQRGELQHLFPGTLLDSAAPKLLLVAPALSFHSSNEIVLSYFSPEIEVERIGINSEWQQHLKVVMRLEGAARPISHRGT